MHVQGVALCVNYRCKEEAESKTVEDHANLRS